MNDATVPSSSRSPLDASTSASNNLKALRAVTASLQELPRLLQLVRSVYRKQNRKPQDEPTVMSWVERYVRFYRTKPLGLLDAAHARAFLSHIAHKPGITTAMQDEAREAIQFLHAEVLHQDVEPIEGYDRAESHATASMPSSPPDESRSFWDFQES